MRVGLREENDVRVLRICSERKKFAEQWLSSRGLSLSKWGADTALQGRLLREMRYASPEVERVLGPHWGFKCQLGASAVRYL